MLNSKEITNHIFTISSEDDFNKACIAVFKYQTQNNSIYCKYVNSLSITIDNVKHYTQIPFLPIDFFKSQIITCNKDVANSTCFSSSGTTGQITSKHYVSDISLYETSFQKAFELFYGNPTDYCILALLPNYLERTGSSLVYMFDKLISFSNHPLSGFYLNNYDELIQKIEILKQQNQKTLLLGVTYALLDLAELQVKLNSNFIVMETGGMKGRREEMIKEQLHSELKSKLNIDCIHSEYGMTELLSQAYSVKDGLFTTPPWMRILIRDTNDPFVYTKKNKTGGINVIDLANINSCSFIETKDLGRVYGDGSFEIMGRFDNSDIRGCNLMIQ